MDGSELEDMNNSPENSGDMAVSNDAKIVSTSSSKKRRAVQKRVVAVQIKDLLRLKGDLMSSPPSDDWTWRKYGQKPIKGSPFPRGYYRCSSSKGCPARKQVERSKSDPNVMLVTYSYEHNHPRPVASRTNHYHARTSTTPAVTTTSNITTSVSEEEEYEEKKPVNISTTEPHKLALENKLADFGDGPLMNCSEFDEWFHDFESTMLESPISTEDRMSNDEMARIFTMHEEDDSLFADLGELPECSKVFRRGMVRTEKELRSSRLATTG